MDGNELEDHPKSLADILAEELDDCASAAATQDESLEIKQAKLREVYARIHALEPGRSALCLSGGGIRSASFGLGIFLLSWLAAAMMIPRFCLAAIPLQPDDNLLHILLGLGTALISVAMAYSVLDLPSSGNANWTQRRFIFWRQLPLFLAALCLAEWWSGFCTLHGQDEAAFLKTPGGVWTFAGFLVFAYLAGGLFVDIGASLIKKTPRKFSPLPWISRLLAVVVTTALGGAALWAMAANLFPDPIADARRYACFAPVLILAVFTAVNFLFAGLASRVSADEDREWWGRSAGWLLITGITWLASAGLVIFGPFVFTWQATIAKAALGAAGGVTGLITAIVGFSSRSPAKQSPGAGTLSQVLPAAAAIAFFLGLSLGISRVLDGTTALSFRVGEIYAQKIYPVTATPGSATGSSKVHDVPAWTQTYRKQVSNDLLFTMAMLAAGIALGIFINVNKFSLHAVYRNRLIRAFLGASRSTRHPHKFTGFDPNDDLKMRDLQKEKPFHVVNMALNLVRGAELAWQERKAESFTISRLHSGCWRTGYRSSETYGEGISLGTALAISGAAASPNMGYHSSPIVGFLMTLFNLRLGWWLGNPAGAAWDKAGPAYAVGPLFAEASGNTTDKYKYINLSDGGHFENLGLYEMVLRRCRFIVAIDAGCDTEYVFEDLGNAIRKIRVDFGVPIDVKVSSPKVAKGKIHHCAFGHIRYSEVDDPGSDGFLIYIKPVISGDEPADVTNYAAAHPEFPHEATSDQWFSESQIESYRILGAHAIESICGKNWQPKTLAEFFQQVEAQVGIEAAENPQRVAS